MYSAQERATSEEFERDVAFVWRLIPHWIAFFLKSETLASIWVNSIITSSSVSQHLGVHVATSLLPCCSASCLPVVTLSIIDCADIARRIYKRLCCRKDYGANPLYTKRIIIPLAQSRTYSKFYFHSLVCIGRYLIILRSKSVRIFNFVSHSSKCEFTR